MATMDGPVIADLLDTLEYKPPGASADEIHRRAGTRPASQTEVTRLPPAVRAVRHRYQAEHRAGTSLPGCLKVCLPDWDGDWRMIFQIATDEAGPLSYLGCGVGHQPRGTRAPDANQIAHHRLHGRWPRRRLS